MIGSRFTKNRLALVILALCAGLHMSFVFAFSQNAQVRPSGSPGPRSNANLEKKRKTNTPHLTFILRSPHIDMEDRLKAISARIRRVQRYPSKARRLGIEGTAVVLFQISLDGSLKDLRIQKTSGNTTLDKASLEVIRRAAPFPYVRGPLVLSIRYNLKEEEF